MGNTLGNLKSRIPCFENTMPVENEKHSSQVKGKKKNKETAQEKHCVRYLSGGMPLYGLAGMPLYGLAGMQLYGLAVGLDSAVPTSKSGKRSLYNVRGMRLHGLAGMQLYGLAGRFQSAVPNSESVGLDSAAPASESGNLQYTEPVGFDAAAPTSESDNNKTFYQKRGKGLLLILNSTHDRRGTEKDVDNLKTFFKNQLDYAVYDPRSEENDDLTTEQINKQLNKIKSELNDNGRSYHCFICVILSHGNENGIKTRDGFMNAEDIRQEFNNKAVSKFAGRPKVFLIQACRGGTLQKRHATRVGFDNSPATKEQTARAPDATVCVPTDADTLLAFSTTPGYASVRHKKEGTWFINECLNEFKRNYQNEHLEEMLITVRNTIAYEYQHEGGKQMPCVWTTLTRRLML